MPTPPPGNAQHESSVYETRQQLHEDRIHMPIMRRSPDNDRDRIDHLSVTLIYQNIIIFCACPPGRENGLSLCLPESERPQKHQADPDHPGGHVEQHSAPLIA